MRHQFKDPFLLFSLPWSGHKHALLFYTPWYTSLPVHLTLFLLYSQVGHSYLELPIICISTNSYPYRCCQIQNPYSLTTVPKCRFLLNVTITLNRLLGRYSCDHHFRTKQQYTCSYKYKDVGFFGQVKACLILGLSLNIILYAHQDAGALPQ